MRLSVCRAWFVFVCGTAVVGCASWVDALFGDSVEVDPADASPPRVRLVVLDSTVRRPEPGELVVTSEDRSAWVYPTVRLAALGEDPQGVRFVEIQEITIEPTCAATPEGRGGRAPPVPTFLPAPPVVLPGARVETPPSSATATTRLPVFKTFDLAGGTRAASRWCPEDRPLLGNAIARVRARAANFGGGLTESATAVLSLNPVGGGSLGVPIRPGGARAGGGDAESCSGAGSPCRTHPAECDGRGPDWMVPGTIECRGGEPVCVARANVDYCTSCGGECGGCAGHSCTAEHLCAPGAVCAREPRLGGSVQHCRSLTIAESSTGNRPCTPIAGFCWLPGEVGQETLICAEARD